MSTIRTEADKRQNDIASGINNSIMPGSTVYIDDTKKHTGPFFAITAMQKTEIDVSECNTNVVESDGSGAIQATTTNIVIPMGVTIYGNFSSIELEQGIVMAYAKDGVTVTVEA
jgi:hypothetical protein